MFRLLKRLLQGAPKPKPKKAAEPVPMLRLYLTTYNTKKGVSARK